MLLHVFRVAAVAACALFSTIAPSQAGRVHVAYFCGLFSFDLCMRELRADARAAGHTVSVYSHLADPVSVARAYPGRRLILIGHSAGADKVLAHGGAAKAALVVSIDPTILNRGAPRGVRTVSFYNPANRIPLVVCCGGAHVDGAENVVVGSTHLRIVSNRIVRERIGRLIASVAR